MGATGQLSHGSRSHVGTFIYTTGGQDRAKEGLSYRRKLIKVIAASYGGGHHLSSLSACLLYWKLSLCPTLYWNICEMHIFVLWCSFITNGVVYWKANKRSIYLSIYYGPTFTALDTTTTQHQIARLLVGKLALCVPCKVATEAGIRSLGTHLSPSPSLSLNLSRSLSLSSLWDRSLDFRTLANLCTTGPCVSSLVSTVLLDERYDAAVRTRARPCVCVCVCVQPCGRSSDTGAPSGLHCQIPIRVARFGHFESPPKIWTFF